MQYQIQVKPCLQENTSQKPAAQAASSQAYMLIVILLSITKTIFIL
jgi:hypothetical protein